MALRLGDIAPDFLAETIEGRLSFHEWLDSGWGVLFSNLKDVASGTLVGETTLKISAVIKFSQTYCLV